MIPLSEYLFGMVSNCITGPQSTDISKDCSAVLLLSNSKPVKLSSSYCHFVARILVYFPHPRISGKTLPQNAIPQIFPPLAPLPISQYLRSPIPRQRKCHPLRPPTKQVPSRRRSMPNRTRKQHLLQRRTPSRMGKCYGLPRARSEPSTRNPPSY